MKIEYTKKKKKKKNTRHAVSFMDFNISFFRKKCTVKILKFGTPQTIAIIVLKIEKFDVTLH